ncbi:MAG: hypothetical protein ACK5BV_01070 [Bacteroidota bacterium]
MSTTQNIQDFLDENVALIKDYLETKTDIYKLKAIRSSSVILGSLVWIIISAFLFFLLFIFIGLVLGFWFSELTNSFTIGFGLATLLIFVVMLLVALFRKQLFIYPMIRIFIKMMTEGHTNEEK